MKDTHLIPSGLCQHIFGNKLWNEAKVYYYLKSRCSGVTTIDTPDRLTMARALCMSDRLIKTTLSRLIAINWIGHNIKTGRYYLCAVSGICERADVSSRRRYWFNTKNLSTIKGFITAVLINETIQIIKYKKWKKKTAKVDAVRLSKGTIKASPPAVFFPISVRYFAARYGISKTKAHVLIKLAEANEYIKIIKKDIPYLFEGQKIKSNLIREIVRLDPDLRSKVFAKNGLIYIRDASLIKTNIFHKTVKVSKSA